MRSMPNGASRSSRTSDSPFKATLIQIVNQMRTSIAKIQQTIGGDPPPVAPECVDLGKEIRDRRM